MIRTSDPASQRIEKLWEAVVAATRPPAADVELWRFTSPRLDDGALDAAARRGWLTADERMTAERRAHAELRSRFGGRRILRRLVAAASLGAPPEQIEVTARCGRCGGTDHGPPTVGWNGGEPVRMSTSSSGDQVVIALSRGSVGVDIESPDRAEKVPVHRIARAVAGWNRVAKAHPGASATEIWAAVEALAKTTGQGLRASAPEIEQALAVHHLLWTTDGHGLTTCIATSVAGASVVTIDIRVEPEH